MTGGRKRKRVKFDADIIPPFLLTPPGSRSYRPGRWQAHVSRLDRRNETIFAFPLKFRTLMTLVLASLVGGCATWKDDSRQVSLVGNPVGKTAGASNPSARRSIMLDVEFVPIQMDAGDDSTAADVSASMWQWVDETAIDVTLRRRLLENGLRVGMVSNSERFRERIATIATEQDVIDQFLTSASVASDVSRGEKKIPMRIGKRYELPLRQPIEGTHVGLARLDGETIGKTLADAQYLFAIEPIRSTGQKQIQLLLRPEIQHGEMRQQWIGSESTFRIGQRRPVWSFPTLDLNLEVSEGDVIVIAPTMPITGLATRMFSGLNANQQEEQIVLLIKIDNVPTAADGI